MSAFDAFLIVDWSANNTPKRGKDSIWCALVDAHGAVVSLKNPSTRAQAMAEIVETIDRSLTEGKRLLAGFDFGFGYTHGLAERLCGVPGWEAVWQRIATEIDDNDDNSSNRFEVGSRFNDKLAVGGETPFWGRPAQHEGRYPNLPAKKPPYRHLPEKRVVETLTAGTQPVFKLAYTGSVGSQTLLGIARLQALRERYGDAVAIWPFQTDFERNLSAPVVITEVYPSMGKVDIQPDEVKDAAQVRSLACHFARSQSTGELRRMLSFPSHLDEGTRERAVREEGWIVGAGHGEIEGTEASAAVNPKTTKTRFGDGFDYLRDPAEIYRQSFATVRREAKLEQLPPAMQTVAERLIHSCGMVDLVDDLGFSDDAAEHGRKALSEGASIWCDVEMVRSGIIASRLAGNDVRCTLNAEQVPDLADRAATTRSAAAVNLWEPLEGSICVIGNAPTALFRLLERISVGAGKPALIVGIPVGFVGAVESKQALAAFSPGLDYITVHGRRGGSAMAASVINALAGDAA